MTYSLELDARALKEWCKLGDTVRQQFKKTLAEILESRRIEANRLHSLPDCYKIRLRSSGWCTRSSTTRLWFSWWRLASVSAHRPTTWSQSV